MFKHLANIHLKEAANKNWVYTWKGGQMQQWQSEKNLPNNVGLHIKEYKVLYQHSWINFGLLFRFSTIAALS